MEEQGFFYHHVHLAHRYIINKMILTRTKWEKFNFLQKWLLLISELDEQWPFCHHVHLEHRYILNNMTLTRRKISFCHHVHLVHAVTALIWPILVNLAINNMNE